MEKPPACLKSILTYLLRATEIENKEPLVAYYCQYYALQEGFKELQAGKLDEEGKQFILKLMDKLEKKKTNLELPEEEIAADIVQNFTLSLFKKLDDIDRAGKATKATAQGFFACGVFFSVLKQFGPLPQEIEERRLYAQFKAVDITKALKRGERPVAGPPGGLEDPAAPEPMTNPSPLSPTDSAPLLPSEIEGPTGFSAPPSSSSFPSPPQPSSSSSSSFPPTQPAPSTSFPTPPPPSSSSSFPAVPAPAPAHTSSYGSSSFPAPSQSVSVEDCTLSEKYCRFAISALQFQDTTTAVDNLKKALAVLTTQKQ